MNTSIDMTVLSDICNIQELCRLCLTKCGDRIQLFGLNTKIQRPLSEELRETGCIDAHQDDQLPSLLCTLCVNTIEKFAQFRNKCKQSELFLRKWLDNNNKKDLKIHQPKIASEVDTEVEEKDKWLQSWNCQISDSEEDSGYSRLSDTVQDDGNTEHDNEAKENKKGKKSKRTPAVNTSLRCEECLTVCNSHSALHYHRLKHSGLKPHTCCHCQKRFHQRCSLVKHMRTHTGERPYTCDKCGKTFSQESNLKFHLTSHSSEKVFCCHVCGKGFTLGHNLKAHLKIHSGLRERLYPCEICSKSFYYRSHLRNHVRSHTGDRPHSCDTCGKAFIKRSYLKQHYRVHTGERPYKCTMCVKTFTNSSNLSAHLRCHTGDSRYSCLPCNKKFTHKNKMVAHINSHHGGVTPPDKLLS